MKDKKRRNPVWCKVDLDHFQIKRDWAVRLLYAETLPQVATAKPTRTSPANNVVGVGLAEKVTRGKGKKRVCLRFLVQRKYKKVSKKNEIPKKIGSLFTDVVEVGMPRGLMPAVPIAHPQHGPIGPGCSISFFPPSPADIGAGTVAAIVTDGVAIYLLSANHVIADEDFVPLGTPIFHPGSLDHPPGQRIGQLHRSVPLFPGTPNRVDCAIAKLDPGVPWTATIPGGLGKPTGVMPAFQKQLVSKFGRTTHRRDGQISNLLQDVKVQLRHRQYPMDDQIEVVGLGGAFAEEGDSGSLVVDTGSKAAVGIICARAGALTFVSPIREVLMALGVRLV